MASEPVRQAASAARAPIDAALEQIYAGINDLRAGHDLLRAGLDEIKHEAIAAGSQLESLTRQVSITNGSVTRHEGALRELQNAELVRATIETEKGKAASQQPAKSGDIVISKTTAMAFLSGGATVVLAIGEAVRRYMEGM